MRLDAQRNSSPDFNVGSGNSDFGPAHSNGRCQLEPRRECQGLRFDEKLICQRVERVHILIFGRVPRKAPRINSAMT